MNTKLVTSCLLAAALALPIAGYSADRSGDGDSDRSSPKAFAKDSVITTKIKAELFEERMSSLLHIQVDTDKKGAVVLSGTTESQSAADKAVTIAHNVKGVKSVQNNIQIRAEK